MLIIGLVVATTTTLLPKLLALRTAPLYPRSFPPIPYCPRVSHPKLQQELGLAVRLSAGAVGSRDAEALLKAADRAMYEAKHRGKDRIFV